MLVGLVLRPQESVAGHFLHSGAACVARDGCALPGWTRLDFLSLARPQAWPFAALYGVVLVAAERRRGCLVAASLALSPLLWVLPDWWGSGDPLHAERVARVNLIAAGTHPGLHLLDTGWTLVPAPVWVLALASVGLAAHRREWTVLVLGLTATSWIGVEAAATTLGYPGATRFLVLPAALACVLAGIGGAWLAQTAPRPARPLLAAGLIAAALPFLGTPAAALLGSAQASVTRARFQLDLRRSVERAGGYAALHSRGAPPIPGGLWWNAGALAWDLQPACWRAPGSGGCWPSGVRRQRPALAADEPERVAPARDHDDGSALHDRRR